MTSRIQRFSFTLSAVLIAYLVIWFTWVVNHQLVLSLAVIAAGLWVVAMIQAPDPAPEAAPALALALAPVAVSESPALSTPLLGASEPPQWRELALGVAGLAFAWMAYRAVLDQHWLAAVLCLAAGAVAWRMGLPLQLPKLSRGLLTGLLLLAVLAGSAFRLYKVGVVPTGLAMMDESNLKNEVYQLYQGSRPTVELLPGVMGDGTVPHYMEALGMKVFGTSLTGYRLSAVVVGISIIGLIFLLGSFKGDPWVGLSVAFLWAMCIWPVSISRAHYLMIESHLVVLLCLYFLFKGFELGRPIHFALAGLFWAFTLQVYHAAQVMLALVPWLLFLVWYLRANLRVHVMRGVLPLGAGFLLGMAPMLLWAWTDPHNAYLVFFGVVFAGHTAGTVAQSMGPLQALDMLLGRAIPCFPRTIEMLTVHGPFHSFFFPSVTESTISYPVFDQSVFFLFLVGLSVCLARFRNPFYAFLIFWWAAGLLPGLVSEPSYQPDDRRSMMLLPPLLMIASAGFVTSLDFLGRAFKGRAKTAFFLAAGLAFFGFLAAASWHAYFDRNQKDLGLLTWDKANQTSQARAIFEEDQKGPVVVVSTQRQNADFWNAPNDNSYNTVYQSMFYGPITYTQAHADYYTNEGLFGALRWAVGQGQGAPKRPDVLVALTPFHFYLEPLLQRLGGKTVREIPVVQSNQGPLLFELGMAPPVDGVGMKLVRLNGFNPAAIDAIRDASLFNFQVDEVTPPGRDRDAVSQEYTFQPDMLKLVDDYQRSPAGWKTGRSATFKLPDPWFWMCGGNLPGGIIPPLRMKVSFDLVIPSDGAYSFGASSSAALALKLNHKAVFTYVPRGPEGFAREREGILGDPVGLKAGTYRLDAEQLWLSAGANYNQAFRLVWRRPGGSMETLPLEVLRPVPGPGSRAAKARPEAIAPR